MNEPNIYRFDLHKNSPVFKGMPSSAIYDHPAAIILLQVGSIPLSQILYGKRFDKSVEGYLVPEEFRMYEFTLHNETGRFGMFHLYIKGKENWFTSPSARAFSDIIHVGHTQRIPFTWKVLSRLSDEEIKTIYWDFD